MSATEPPSEPDPDRDTHIAFPDLEDTPTVPGRPRLSHTTAFPGGRPVHRPATPVRPPGTGRRWGVWVAGAVALTVLLGVGGGVHVGVGDGASVVSVGAGPGFGDEPGMDPGFGSDTGDGSGDAPPAYSGPASLASWTELAGAQPLGGAAPLVGRQRQVHPVPADLRQMRVEVVGDGAVTTSTVVTVDGQDSFDAMVGVLPWVAEAAVQGADLRGATSVRVDVEPASGTGTLECRIYAGGTLVSVDTAEGPVTCAVTFQARSR